MRLASTCVLALGVAAFAGSAYAGNDNNKGKHDAASGGSAAVDAQASAPGNSANAPGQLKKEAEAAKQDVQAATAAAPAANAGSAGSSAAAQIGVKPASDTEKDTREAASSDKTKQYGNGKTAGQIAMQNGAPASTILHGPGNSQPHKAAPCAGGHEVDVHALKGKRLAKTCGPASPPPGSNPDPNPNPSPNPKPGPTPGPGSNPGGSTGGGGNSPSSGGSTAGPVTTAGSNGSPEGVTGSEGSERVLAETGVAGQSGSLPFTGFPLWVALFVGIGLIGSGLLLRRRTKVIE
jgi:hypothetical protein